MELVAAHVRLGVDGHPEVGWAVSNTIAEKARRGDADDCEGLGLNGDGGTDDGGVAGELGLPGSVAEHECR